MLLLDFKNILKLFFCFNILPHYPFATKNKRMEKKKRDIKRFLNSLVTVKKKRERDRKVAIFKFIFCFLKTRFSLKRDRIYLKEIIQI